MKYFIFLFTLALFTSCSEESRTNNKTNTKESKEVIHQHESTTPALSDKPIELEEKIDLNMDISNLSLSDIRILRNSFAARQGYCFMQADLRAYFSTTSWYDKRMEERYWKEEDGQNISPISYSKEEQVFIQKLKNREDELKAKNFYNDGKKTFANLNNIINLFQFENVDPKLLKMLGDNGFAIVPNDNIQLFHVYEQNDYNQLPNFVTTDMYMQLFHMYFGYILRTVEEEQFIPIATQLCSNMMKEMRQVSTETSNQELKSLAEYNETYYAIAYTLLTKTETQVPVAHKQHYLTEIKNVNASQDEFSNFLDYKDVYFPYSLFKPRGHYTRTESLKSYFKAMMWLQTAPFCLENDLHLKRAILSADVLSKNQKSTQLYQSLLEPISFIIGEPDNVSFMNLSKKLKTGGYLLENLISNRSTLEKFRKEIKIIANAQNKIKPKIEQSCPDKINFIPQRYLADNEVLQELVDTESSNSKRAYPKGLDVMAAFGSKTAKNILFNELDEAKKWTKYPSLLSKLESNMKTVNWNATLYNKWIESLLQLQKTEKNYPYFMQNPQWNKKDLNASLASWAELKHDAILYAEQPMAAECGGGGPPAPYTVGYVEPNINYWKSVIELIDLTKSVLVKHQLMTSSIAGVTTRLKENAQFLLSASKKELAGEKLSRQEYAQIEVIGSTFEWLTLDLVRMKDQYIDGWENVIGPDKSVAVVADIYTSNAPNNPEKGILHVANGNVNDIFVLVEIEGYLYITKGAVLSYYEFNLPMGNRLTDEEWQSLLKSKKAPKQPDWIKEIIVPIHSPKSNEKIFYSSGC
jgi:hypothetical protein